MLFFFRAESAYSIRGPDARRGHDPAPETPARGRIRAPYPTVLRSVIPSFSSLLLSVLGCMPALSAAPPAPARSRSTAPASPSRDAWKIAAGEADVAIPPEAVKLLEDIHKLVIASTAKVPYVKADRIFTDDIRAGVDLLKNYRF